MSEIIEERGNKRSRLFARVGLAVGTLLVGVGAFGLIEDDAKTKEDVVFTWTRGESARFFEIDELAQFAVGALGATAIIISARVLTEKDES